MLCFFSKKYNSSEGSVGRRGGCWDELFILGSDVLRTISLDLTLDTSLQHEHGLLGFYSIRILKEGRHQFEKNTILGKVLWGLRRGGDKLFILYFSINGLRTISLDLSSDTIPQQELGLFCFFSIGIRKKGSRPLFVKYDSVEGCWGMYCQFWGVMSYEMIIGWGAASVL